MAKNVLVAQDLSCYGQVSLSVALPLLGACGLSPTALPSALLSTHTGGFGDNTFCDLSGQMPAIFHHWQKIGVKFDAAYLGYLGSQAINQINTPAFFELLSDDCLLVVDPVMGDHGKLYRGFDQAYVEKMKKLITHACVVTPNFTEAQLLCGRPLTTSPVSFTNARQLAVTLAKQFGVNHVIISGIPQPDNKLGLCGYSAEGNLSWSRSIEKLRGDFFGTGDIFASVIVVGLIHHLSLQKAANLAVSFIKTAIMHTPADQDLRLGVNYAAGIGWLLDTLAKKREDIDA